MTLPSADAGASSRAQSWIVGAELSGAAEVAATRHGAERIASGAYLVRRGAARSLAHSLRRRGVLTYAHPDGVAWRAQAPSPDPLSASARWRDAVVAPSLVPPRVGSGSPLLALVNSPVDLSHPEWQGGSVTMLREGPVVDEIGTLTASVAAAPANGVGILGIWPGMRALTSPLPDPARITCADSTRATEAAVDAGARVLMFGFGSGITSTQPGGWCFAHYVALQRALRRGVLSVASGGMHFPDGRRLAGEPGTLPHVLTVAAVDRNLATASFTLPGRSVDLAAPGVGILGAVPSRFDTDGNADGYSPRSGTIYPAAMVAAAATWIRALDPSLAPDQVAEILRRSASDLEDPGHDPATGFGLLDLARALEFGPPARDALEPNDDITWVDGRVLGGAPRPLSARRAVRARLTPYEDTDDVYRLRVPGRGAMRVTVKPISGDPALSVYDARARSTRDRARRQGRSTRRGARAETLLVRNRSRQRKTAYAHVYLSPGSAKRNDVRYTITALGGGR